MVVTNHFYLGDRRIDRDLPWEKFVEEYNAANDPAWNESALRFASEPGLLTIGGSDGHGTDSAQAARELPLRSE